MPDKIETDNLMCCLCESKTAIIKEVTYTMESDVHGPEDIWWIEGETRGFCRNCYDLHKKVGYIAMDTIKLTLDTIRVKLN